MHYLGYYGYPTYWGAAGTWGGGAYPGIMLTEYGGFPPVPDVADEKTEEARVRAEQARHQDDDLHLRSCKAIMDYHIEASDGNIGHVAGLLVNEQTWAIRSMIVNTSNWWLGHNMLVAPQWITSVNWHERTVSIDLTRQAVKDAPPYDLAGLVDRTQEISLHEHYGRPGYWESDKSTRV